jgi:hypothetical protein
VDARVLENDVPAAEEYARREVSWFDATLIPNGIRSNHLPGDDFIMQGAIWGVPYLITAHYASAQSDEHALIPRYWESAEMHVKEGSPSLLMCLVASKRIHCGPKQERDPAR